MKDDHYNRYGEKDVRPGHFRHGGGSGALYSGHSNFGQIAMPSFHDDEEDYDWSHDPRSEAASERHYGKGPKSWLTDEKIQERVSHALYISSEVDARDIEIEVDQGRVILRGTVKSRRQKRAAEHCVEFMPGVQDVANLLTIEK